MTKLQRYLAGILALIVIVGLAFCAGDKHGHLNEKLAVNQQAIKKSDSITKSVQIRTNASRLLSDSTVIVSKKYAKQYDEARSHVKVSGDTIATDDSTDDDYISPIVAGLIYAADSTHSADQRAIAALQRSLALQDSLIVGLKYGIALRDTRITMLESAVTPGKFKRLIVATKYVAIGAVIGVALSHR